MHIFLSAGEPSGDLHAANLIHALRGHESEVTVTGFGGERMRRAGAEVLYPLADHAIMGLSGIARALPTMIGLRREMVRHIESRPPDAVVLIDYPGFHWWLAAAAKRRGIPVVSFVPPQVWAWATHRARWIGRWFDDVLCSLPFEADWYHSRGVPQARYVGHPYFDELSWQKPDSTFVEGQRRKPGRIVALLPGSRSGEVKRNLDTLVATAAQVHAERPDVRFLFACFKPKHEEVIARRIVDGQFPAETHVGRTAEIIHLAEACVAVSGSVGLELLHHGTPSIVVYRVNPLYRAIGRWMLHVPYISIVNLLAGEELFPEHLASRDPCAEVASQLLAWLNDPPASARVRERLADLRNRVGRPGACRRAAEVIADIARQRAIAAA
jgi:lipid-A-disaccharide synthase